MRQVPEDLTLSSIENFFSHLLQCLFFVLNVTVVAKLNNFQTRRATERRVSQFWNMHLFWRPHEDHSRGGLTESGTCPSRCPPRCRDPSPDPDPLPTRTLLTLEPPPKICTPAWPDHVMGSMRALYAESTCTCNIPSQGSWENAKLIGGGSSKYRCYRVPRILTPWFRISTVDWLMLLILAVTAAQFPTRSGSLGTEAGMTSRPPEVSFVCDKKWPQSFSELLLFSSGIKLHLCFLFFCPASLQHWTAGSISRIERLCIRTGWR